MHQDLDSGPMDVNAKNRGLTLTSNNAANKNIREGGRPKAGNSRRGRDHARGGHDVASVSFGSTASDPRRQYKGGRKSHQQQPPVVGTKQQQHYPDQHSTSHGAAVMKDDEFEVGSVFNAGSKKQNLNHLLNFQFEPRGNHGKKNLSHQRGGKSRGRNYSDGRPKYNKEQYLQANCQFVVKSSGNYSAHLADPDTLVDWNLIEQVVLKTTSDVPSCPICLYPPKAAKITRCGHVFCWPCILHYLALSDHAWRKCPICYEAIHRPDLKSVISIPWKEFQVNDEIELCLMRRDRNSLFAMPVDQYFPEVNAKHPNVNDRFTSHSNLLLATPAQVVQGIIAKERFELEDQYRAEKDEPEACFIEEALQYLSQRESGIDMPKDISEDVISEEGSSSNGNSSADEASCLEQQHYPQDIQEDEANPRPRHASSSSDGTLESLDEEEVTVEDLDIDYDKKLQSKAGNCSPKNVFYFYQCSDGQPIFLHALNVQMLIHEYGSLEACPTKIRGKIVEKDHTSMTEELRNRLRYLTHMPLTSSFEVCEIQLVQPCVSKETLNEFATQLESRRRKRNRRAREERRREKWIQVEENKQMGKYPNLKCRIESAYHFPQVGAMDVPKTRSTESLASSQGAYGSSAEGGATDGGTFSFAKMLREGVAKPSSSKVATLTTSSKNVDSEPEPEDYVPPPPKTNLGDALAHAFAQATITTACTAGVETKKKKSKKMKGQKISLTSSARPMMD